VKIAGWAKACVTGAGTSSGLRWSTGATGVLYLTFKVSKKKEEKEKENPNQYYAKER
jgi:hypothetical protein